MKPSTFYITTLGCKVNQYESQSLRESWRSLGWKETFCPEDAGVILVNSCAITAKAVADVRAEIRKLHRAAPDASIIVTGCAVEAAYNELAPLPGVKHIVRQNDKELLARLPFEALHPASSEKVLLSANENILPLHEILPESSHASLEENNIVAEEKKRHSAALRQESRFPKEMAENIRANVAFPEFSVSDYARSRAVLKIQDGCSHFCSFCIVPFTRGKARSRELASSFAEVERLLLAGFREIVISGVNLRQYGTPGKHDFWDFMQALEERFSSEWGGKMRFRISSLEPGQLDERSLRILSESTLIAPQLHLSLQSGSPSVLARMHRGHYRIDAISNFLQKLSQAWPVLGLGADIISGFPGETEQEHEETVTLLSELPLSYAHVFPYSARPGTAAARLGNPVAPQIKKRRAAELRQLAVNKKKLFMDGQLQVPHVTVALENNNNDNAPLHGINEYYAECTVVTQNALGEYADKVNTPSRQTTLRNFMRCRPVALRGDTLLVVALEHE